MIAEKPVDEPLDTSTNNEDDDRPIKQEPHFKQESRVSVKQETRIKKEPRIPASIRDQSTSRAVHPLPQMLVPKTPTPTRRTSHKRTRTEVSSGSSSLPENPVQFWMQRQQKRREEEAQRQNHETESLESPLPRSPLPESPLPRSPLLESPRGSSLLSLTDRTRTLPYTTAQSMRAPSYSVISNLIDEESMLATATSSVADNLVDPSNPLSDSIGLPNAPPASLSNASLVRPARTRKQQKDLETKSQSEGNPTDQSKGRKDQSKGKGKGKKH